MNENVNVNEYVNNHYVQRAKVKLFDLNGNLTGKTYILDSNDCVSIANTQILFSEDNIYPKEIEKHKLLSKLETNYPNNVNNLIKQLTNNLPIDKIFYFTKYIISDYLRNIINNNDLDDAFNKQRKLSYDEIICFLEQIYSAHLIDKNNNRLSKFEYSNYFKEIFDYINKNGITFLTYNKRNNKRKHKKLFHIFDEFYNIFLNNIENHSKIHPLKIFLDGGRQNDISIINKNYIKYFFYSNIDKFILAQPVTVLIDDNLKKCKFVLSSNLLSTISPNIIIGLFKNENKLLDNKFKNIIKQDNNRIINITDINDIDFLNKILFEGSSKKYTICKYDVELNKLKK